MAEVPISTSASIFSASELAEADYNLAHIGEMGREMEPMGDAAKELDGDQKEALEKYKGKTSFLISAGPGAGKTFTLIRIALDIAQTSTLLRSGPSLSVLFLCFNVAAEDTISDRLRQCGVMVADRRGFNLKRLRPGIYCMTFNKFAATFFRGKSGMKYQEQVDGAATILSSLRLPVKPIDYLIIDEAQDINSTFRLLVDGVMLQSKHHIIAGDPRQEVYTGATWFSGLWAERSLPDSQILRYNHRSGRVIVDAINTYSRAAFNVLHHDQLPCREGGEVSVVQCLSESETSSVIVTELTKHKGSEVYIIAPVTVEKYFAGVISSGVKEELHRRHLSPAVILGGSLGDTTHGSSIDLSSDVYYIGTAKKLKGTEKKVVIVIGLNSPYQRFGIAPDDLNKATFVAISRPMDKLILITEPGHFGGKVDTLTPLRYSSNPIYELIRYAKGGELQSKGVEEAKNDYLPDVKTKDDLAQNCSLPLRSSPSKSIPVLNLNVPKGLEAFAGRVIEAFLFRRLDGDLNALVLRWMTAEFVYEDRGKGYIIGELSRNKDDQLVIVFAQRENLQIPDSLSRYLGGTAIEVAYLYASLAVTIESGRWITYGEPLIEGLCTEVRDAMRTYPIDLPPHPRFQTGFPGIFPFRQPAKLARGEAFPFGKDCPNLDASARLIGIADFVYPDLTVEIKYSSSDDGLRQVATYAGLASPPTDGLVLNLKTGTSTRVKPAEKEEIRMYTQAFAILRFAHSYRSPTTHLRRMKEFDGATLVSISTSASAPRSTGLVAWRAGQNLVEMVKESTPSGEAEILPLIPGRPALIEWNPEPGDLKTSLRSICEAWARDRKIDPPTDLASALGLVYQGKFPFIPVTPFEEALSIAALLSTLLAWSFSDSR